MGWKYKLLLSQVILEGVKGCELGQIFIVYICLLVTKMALMFHTLQNSETSNCFLFQEFTAMVRDTDNYFSV